MKRRAIVEDRAQQIQTLLEQTLEARSYQERELAGLLLAELDDEDVPDEVLDHINVDLADWKRGHSPSKSEDEDEDASTSSELVVESAEAGQKRKRVPGKLISAPLGIPQFKEVVKYRGKMVEVEWKLQPERCDRCSQTIGNTGCYVVEKHPVMSLALG
ncbi:hypothetical protein B0H12DRAFT_1246678 [Mycena haematopus]|nr:hypothetical protein B0H12DRAFT_1246678 [Mycena haematopus]